MPAREKPILMSAPMVRAILDGRKTQTRRLVVHEHIAEADVFSGPPVTLAGEWEFGIAGEGGVFAHGDYIRCPFGAPGDRLWVRETWWRGRWTEEHHYNDIDGVSRCSVLWCHHRPGDAETIAYAADGDPPTDRCEGWDKMPSIFLPRLDSRITLEITDVRVQRLQEINEGDAREEGCRGMRGAVGQMIPMPPATAREDFERLWDAINGERAPWSSNPWCWAITFRRMP